MWLALFVIQLAISNVDCFVNVAHEQGFRGRASMGAQSLDPVWSADKAIDGGTYQNHEYDSCAITNWDENRNVSIWWKVWLQTRFNIAYLEIYFRSDTYQRSTGFSIYTYDTQDFDPLRDRKHPVYHHNPMSGCPSPIMNVTVNYVTQGIVFINERSPGYRSNCPGDDIKYTGIEICEIRLMGCPANRYSPGCHMICPSKCNKNQCDAFDGSCIHGCSDPDALTIDCIVCDDWMYVKNKTCVRCQGHCKDRTPCNKLTGLCENGCDKNWTGPFCQQCEDGFYNSGCSSTCGHCSNREYCNKITGHCPRGCQSHFLPPFCLVCEVGFHGSSCNNACAHCLNEDSCDEQNGICLNWCHSNFLYPFCIECKDGFYGVKCSKKCGRCVDEGFCDKTTGYCFQGCKRNFRPPFCKDCADGFYDSNCNSTCGQCLNGEPCNKTSGHCLRGCQFLFHPPLCQDCVDGFYGSSCDNECGHCRIGDSCDKWNGTCLTGCQSYFQYPLCKDLIYLQWKIESPMDEENIVFYVIIGILTALLVLAVVVIIHQRRQMSHGSHQTENTQGQRQTPPQNYDDMAQSEEEHVYTTVDTAKEETIYHNTTLNHS